MFILHNLCRDPVHPPGEKFSLFTPIKDFLDVYNVKHRGQTKNT